MCIGEIERIKELIRPKDLLLVSSKTKRPTIKTVKLPNKAEGNLAAVSLFPNITIDGQGCFVGIV